MTEWDKEYLKLCRKILSEGVEVENRTGINTIKIPSYELSFDLRFSKSMFRCIRLCISYAWNI